MKRSTDVKRNTQRRRRANGTRKHTARTSVAHLDQKIVLMFLQMLNTVKLYHWKTSSYAQHKATDELYGELNTNIDAFVETMLGYSGGRVNLTGHKTLPLMDYTNVNDFSREVARYKDFLIHLDIEGSDLLNIRDEILGSLNKFSYLLTFK